MISAAETREKLPVKCQQNKVKKMDFTNFDFDVDLDLIDLELVWLTHKPLNCPECIDSLATSIGMHDYALPPLGPEPVAESLKMHDYAKKPSKEEAMEFDFIDVEKVEVKTEHENEEDQSPTLCQKCHLSHDPAYICNFPQDYKCKKCGKMFNSPSCLKRHESTHTKEKNYFCPQCGKGFARRDVLRRHIRMHNGEKPYECELCGKRFTDSGNLRCHEMTHFKARPHMCLNCGKRFKTKWYLEKHQQFQSCSSEN